MKTVIALAFFFVISTAGLGQSADLAFHTAAKQYIDEKNTEAKRTLDDAIVKYPADRRLRELRDKIKEEEKEKEKEKQDQEKKDNQDQDKKDQEKKDQENKDQKDQNEKGQEKKDADKKEGDKKEDSSQQDQGDKEQQAPSLKEKLEQMNMSEEKAKMILDALKNQEVQYLQQNKRKATQPKDNSKPDW